MRKYFRMASVVDIYGTSNGALLLGEWLVSSVASSTGRV